MGKIYSKDQREYYERFHTIAPSFVENNLADCYSKKLTSILDSNGAVLRGGHALEVGCGYGAVMERMMKHYPEIHFTGIEISEKRGKQAAKKGLEIIIADAEELPLCNKYTLVYGTAILHHLINIDLFLRNTVRYLHKDAVVLFGPQPTRYMLLYILWHLARKSWRVEKGMMQITRTRMLQIFLKYFARVKTYYHGNAFASSMRWSEGLWTASRLAELPWPNDLYVYAQAPLHPDYSVAACEKDYGNSLDQASAEQILVALRIPAESFNQLPGLAEDLKISSKTTLRSVFLPCTIVSSSG